MATAMESIELELCPNCKREIPQTNYVMHTMHCARNISLCSICKQSIPKGEIEAHKAKHQKASEKQATSATSSKSIASASAQLVRASATTTWKHEASSGFRPEKLGYASSTVSTSTLESQGETCSKAPPRIGLNKEGAKLKTTGATPKVPHNDLSACKYCELELPKDTMKEHEDYCGTRTDKCNECGEFVMFKYKRLHEESNHGFIKLNDEPGPKPSWDSSSQRASSVTATTTIDSSSTSTRRSLNSFDMSSLTGSTLFNMADYIPPSLTSGGGSTNRYSDDAEIYRPSGGIRNQKKIDYKDLSRRLDCKTEYIRNLLHDSACITAPLRTTATQPRNHFNHNKGMAPQPPASRRPNPPTELTIPCEFCKAPIPHEDLIQHETGCRPDLARFNPRRRRQDEEFYRYTPSPPPSPEVQLPCEFCSDMIPASQLLRHQATCN